MNKIRKLNAFALILGVFFIVTNINYNNINAYSKISKIKIADEDDIFGEFTITSPSNHDILRIGEIFTIKWNFMGDVKYVSIALYKNMELIDSIAVTTKNDGEYKWIVGQYEESIDYSIRIWDFNNYITGDFSYYFHITSDNENHFDLIISLFIIIGTSLGLAFIFGFFLKEKVFSENRLLS